MKGSTEGDPFILEKTGGSECAIFDFGAEGPIFGTDALQIPLGRAPSMGSSYAGTMGAVVREEVKTAKSRQGPGRHRSPRHSMQCISTNKRWFKLRLMTSRAISVRP